MTSSSSPDVAIPEEGHRPDPARGEDAQGCQVALGLVQVILIICHTVLLNVRH